MPVFRLQNAPTQVRSKFGCGVRMQDIVVSANSCGHERHKTINKTGRSCGRVGPSDVLHNAGKAVGRVGDVEVLCPAVGSSGQIAMDVHGTTMELRFHCNFADGRC